MDFTFSEEQEAVRELAAQIFSDHADHDRIREVAGSDDRLDHELWQALGSSNLLGLAIPEAHGGSGMGMTELAIVLEEQGRCVAQVPVLASAVMAGLALSEYGSEAQQSAWLPRVASGESILSVALEEHAGFDPACPRTVARKDGEDWVLEGEKIAVSAAHLADRILVPAATGEGRVGVFLVDPKAPGVEGVREDTTNREPCSVLVLTGARVPGTEVLGDASEGAGIVRFIEARGMVGVAATMLGVAAEALRRTAEYTGARRQFEKPIGSFQGVSLRAADGYIDVECMRSTLWQALWKLDSGLPADVEIAVAKWWSSHGGHRVVHTAQHLHGGTGADTDYPIHRFLLWFKQLDLTLGGAAPQLARIGERIAQGA
jgi:alkylation response protein AidB-like acyl-CoA dehydrogenase